jgi:hypothetical protein
MVLPDYFSTKKEVNPTSYQKPDDIGPLFGATL